MTWYAANLLFEAKVDDSSPDTLCEESLRLVDAVDEDAAELAALEVGRLGEHSYQNETGQTVVWRFVRILEIQELESEIGHGIEVFSRLFRRGLE